jgi:hypothetical protein
MYQSITQEENFTDAKLLWDKMFETFFERMRYKTITIEEARHVIDEIILLLRAIKGYKNPWNSVIDVALYALKKDMTTKELLQTYSYDRSTIYRALNRLTAIGFLMPVTQNSEEVWTINRDRFPILFHVSRL